MLDITRLAVPAIAILAIGGVISFLLAYSFYPEKHENVTVDDRCYELLGTAHEQYVNLAARRDIETSGSFFGSTNRAVPSNVLSYTLNVILGLLLIFRTQCARSRLLVAFYKPNLYSVLLTCIPP